MTTAPWEPAFETAPLPELDDEFTDYPFSNEPDEFDPREDFYFPDE